MKLTINDIALDNMPTVAGAIQQLIKLRRFIAEQLPEENPATVDVVLQMVVAPLNIKVNTSSNPVFTDLDPSSLQPMETSNV